MDHDAHYSGVKRKLQNDAGNIAAGSFHGHPVTHGGHVEYHSDDNEDKDHDVQIEVKPLGGKVPDNVRKAHEGQHNLDDTAAV